MPGSGRQAAPRSAEDRLLTVDQVAERLSASEWTIRRWLREGKLTGRKIGGDKLGYRVPESDLVRFIRGEPSDAAEGP